MFIRIGIIIAFIVSFFIPQFTEIPYKQGVEFGNQTCYLRFEEIYENLSFINVMNMTEEDFHVVSGKMVGS